MHTTYNVKYYSTLMYKYGWDTVGNPTLHRLKIFVLIVMYARNISGATSFVGLLLIEKEGTNGISSRK